MIYFISSDRIGHQDSELGKKLMNNFFRTLVDAEKQPSHLLFLERGVYLLTDQFQAVDAVQHLAHNGVTLLACGTCIDYYGLGDKIVTGQVSNMATILGIMHEADKVLKL